MQLSRATFATFALAGAILAYTGCGVDEINAPCHVKGQYELLIDGLWVLTTINGQAVPPKGYAVSSKDYLAGGSVEFSTRSVIGDCSDPDSYSGVAIIHYTIMNAAGQLQQGKDYTGTFDYNRRRELVRFRSSRNWIEGPKSGNTLSVSGLVPSTWNPTTLVFKR
jgi:hypothetical protein